MDFFTGGSTLFQADSEATPIGPSVADFLKALEDPPQREEKEGTAIAEPPTIYNPAGVNYLEREAQNQSLGSSQAQKDFLMNLETMPEFLANAFGALDSADLKTNGVNGSFSPIEHVWHLVDLERDGFAERIRRLRTETRPMLADFDGDLVARVRRL